MPKIYISGKITGLELNEARDNFDKAEKYLNEKFPDFQVINPMKEVPYEKDKTWEEYMLEDIKLLFDCYAIFMLTNWNLSKGARIEHAIAMQMGKSINYQS